MAIVGENFFIFIFFHQTELPWLFPGQVGLLDTPRPGLLSSSWAPGSPITPPCSGGERRLLHHQHNHHHLKYHAVLIKGTKCRGPKPEQQTPDSFRGRGGIFNDLVSVDISTYYRLKTILRARKISVFLIFEAITTHYLVRQLGRTFRQEVHTSKDGRCPSRRSSRSFAPSDMPWERWQELYFFFFFNMFVQCAICIIQYAFCIVYRALFEMQYTKCTFFDATICL